MIASEPMAPPPAPASDLALWPFGDLALSDSSLLDSLFAPGATRDSVAAAHDLTPAALGPIAADPARNRDRFSASYLIALAARIVREVGELWRLARQQDKRLATLSLDTVISFKSPAERAAFTQDLTDAIAALAARYHDDSSPGARPHRLIVAAYPAPKADAQNPEGH